MLCHSFAAATMALAFLCTSGQAVSAAEKAPAAAAEIKLAPHETAI